MPGIPNAPPYDRVEHAYAHFIQEDFKSREYNPWDQRRDGEWVVVYFHQTFKACLFPTLESVSRFYNWSIYRTNVFLTPDELNAAHTTSHLINLYCHLFDATPADNMTGFQMANAVWTKLQETAERYPAKKLKVSNTGDRDKYTIEVEKLRAADLSGQPKQCRIIGEQLGAEGKTTYTEAELDSFARQLIITSKLKTKQDPCRVVAYYLPVLAKLGFLDYPTRRNVEGDADDGPDETGDDPGSSEMDYTPQSPQAGYQVSL